MSGMNFVSAKVTYLKAFNIYNGIDAQSPWPKSQNDQLWSKIEI